MKQTVLYMRMSTDKQENSIDSQREILIPYAKCNNMEIVHEYYDSGISGRSAVKRPAFLQMIDDSANGDFDTVLIYDSSRFARNLEESLIYKTILKKNGATLISATEPTLDDDTSLITDALFGAMNEMYSRKLSKHVRRGMTHDAQQGRHQGRAPFGYDKEVGNSKLIINEKEAEAVRYVFDEYLKGASFWKISKGLSNLGIKSRRGYTLNTGFIKNILRNSSYIGETHWTPIKSNPEDIIITKATHDSIIDNDTFNKAQIRLDADRAAYIKHERPKEAYSHWLVGIVKCKACGANLLYNSRNYTKYDYPQFRCSLYSQNLCNISNGISVSNLEKLIISYLTNISKNIDIAKNVQVIRRPVIGEEKSTIAEKIKKLSAKKERAKQGYLNGIVELEESKSIRVDCDKQISELNNALESIESPKTDYTKLQKDITDLCATLSSDE
ncbi:hypothetical protein FACS1894188_11540 [Clostridia bacterium]|nr:hypothetical protein FACS1894188_11540 [Clostridia bacterium]